MNGKLYNLKMYLDRDASTSEIFYIIPRIFVSGKTEMNESLIHNAQAFRIDKNFESELDFDLSKSSIILQKGMSYYIGFTLFATEGVANISSYGDCKEKHKTIIQSTPISDWQEIPCTLSFELEIKKG